MGFKNYVVIPDARHDWTDEEKEALKNEMSKIYLYRLEQILNKKVPLGFSRIEQFLIWTLKITNNPEKWYEQESVRTIFRCGLAITNGSVGYDGSIYGC